MSRPNNGGPAFPNKGDNTPGHEIYDGMSLRAYFAGQVVAEIYSQEGYETSEAASVAVEIADALIAELNKTD